MKMPVNNNLEPKKFPMEIKFGNEPHTEFHNNLENIKVSLVIAPRFNDFLFGCVEFANATWTDHPIDASQEFNRFEIMQAMLDIFNKKILPTTMENISLTFLIEGITVQELTHVFRQRKATFSSECTGDKFLHDKDFVIPTAIENSPEFVERYKKICLDAKQLYADMVNSKAVNIHDARYIMPRAMETYCYMRMDLKDCLQFIYDRIDKQIQPQSDNVIAYGMIRCLVERYPIMVKVLNSKYIHRQADFYVKTARQNRSSNFYCPDKDSDVFEYNEKDFVYGLKQRDQILGTNPTKDVFSKILHELEDYLDFMEELVDHGE